MIPNSAGQPIGSQMTALDGTGYTGTVTVYVTGDNGTQALGSVDLGLCVNEGNSYFDYITSIIDTAFTRHIAFTFVGAGAITRTVQVGLPYSMLRGVAGQTIGCQMTNLDGTDFTGVTTVRVVGDNGIEMLGGNGSGLCTHKGHGYHGYSTALSDTEYGQIAFIFTGVGAIPKTIVVDTLTAAQAAALAAAESPLAYTIRDLLTDCLLEIGIVGVASEVDPEIYEIALRRLRGMYSTFQAMRLMLFSVERTEYPLVDGQQVYTIGDGGDFDGDWPLWISGAEVQPVGDDIWLPLVPYENRQEWFDESLKTLEDQWPRRFLYEKTYPLGTLTMWPKPTTAATIALATPAPLTVPTSLDTTLVFSPGYHEAWLYNLSKRLVRPMGAKLSAADKAELASDATRSLGLVQRLNDDAPPRSRSDAAIAGGLGYDIRSNQYR